MTTEQTQGAQVTTQAPNVTTAPAMPTDTPAATTQSTTASNGQQTQTQTQSNPTQQAATASQQVEGKESGQQKQEPSTGSVPEKYELKVQDGSLLTPESIEKVSSLAKELGLSNENAQKLLDTENAKIFALQEYQKDAAKKQIEEWRKASLEDKEIGGEHLKQNVELASRVAKQFFSENLVKFLNDSGFGDYPDFVKGMVKIGKAYGEDKIIIPNGLGSSATGKSVAQRMFDKSNHS